MTCTPHPAIETRAHVLRYLARKFPFRSLNDREDAAHEAVCTVIRLGRPAGKREATIKAARALIGRQMQKGKSYSARSPATSIANHQFEDPRGMLDPDEWLDTARLVACEADYESTLDKAHWATHSAIGTAREALGVLKDSGMSWDAVARLVTEHGRPTCGRSVQTYVCNMRGVNDPTALAEAALSAVAALDLPRRRAPKSWPVAVWDTPEHRVANLKPTELAAECIAAAGSAPKLAKRLGVNVCTVYSWRRGATTPGAEHIQAMRVLLLPQPKM